MRNNTCKTLSIKTVEGFHRPRGMSPIRTEERKLISCFSRSFLCGFCLTECTGFHFALAFEDTCNTNRSFVFSTFPTTPVWIHSSMYIPYFESCVPFSPSLCRCIYVYIKFCDCFHCCLFLVLTGVNLLMLPKFFCIFRSLIQKI